MPDPPRPQPDREQQIVDHLPLVRSLARRYANRGEPLEDLVQVGVIGLIKAIDRFDPSRGTDLASFATPTVLGEIRRHFRDKTWMVHVPRGVQDAHARVNRAVDELTGRLRRAPSVREIADEADLTEEEVLDAMAAGGAYQPLSLSRPAGPEEDDAIDVGAPDDGFGWAEGRAALGSRLRELPERERWILFLRFQEGLTQSEIATRVGISQMHVSRLIQRSLETLRRSVGPG
ncbi:MAG TPA: SigB/SigF/SigG family RNA polymerase sigma factor [Miltoncostaeaceae bacterium]|nr:SigB/SigF/SigG family RNA polymerase sigma factor [Miltoncostaeaceae bacterium]